MGPAVVGVAVGGGGAEHELRAQRPQRGDQRLLLGRPGPQAAVAAVEEVERHRAEQRGGPLGLGAALGDGAAGAHLARRQVEDADPPPGAGEAGEGTPAAELDVVRVGADREDVDRSAHGGHSRRSRTGGRCCAIVPRSMRRRRSTRSDRRAEAPGPGGEPPAAEAPGGDEADSLLGRIVGAVLGIFAGRIEGIYAAVVAGVGGAFVMLAWHLAPAQLLTARELSRLTARAEAEVTAAWLVLEVELPGDGAESGEFWVWRHRAALRPCVATRWNAGGAWRDDVFCGAPRPFGDHLDAAELAELGPGVPFAWPRGGAEQAGAPLLDLRIPGPVRDRLARQAPDDFLLPEPMPELGEVRALRSELAVLGHELDRPVDLLVAGWSRGDPPPLALAYDPNGEAALPVATAARARREPNWGGALLFGAAGFFFFQRGLRQLFAGSPPWARWGVVAVTLLFLPWWGSGCRGRSGASSRRWGRCCASCSARRSARRVGSPVTSRRRPPERGGPPSAGASPRRATPTRWAPCQWRAPSPPRPAPTPPSPPSPPPSLKVPGDLRRRTRWRSSRLSPATRRAVGTAPESPSSTPRARRCSIRSARRRCGRRRAASSPPG
ncbi:MAG: hypothetical protein M5U13_15975 [Thermoanaerobaculia bacterium]|nr:hypothetical protein [Thermoanaerobaculia bacterium]